MKLRTFRLCSVGLGLASLLIASVKMMQPEPVEEIKPVEQPKPVQKPTVPDDKDKEATVHCLRTAYTSAEIVRQREARDEKIDVSDWESQVATARSLERRALDLGDLIQKALDKIDSCRVDTVSKLSRSDSDRAEYMAMLDSVRVYVEEVVALQDFLGSCIVKQPKKPFVRPGCIPEGAMQRTDRKWNAISKYVEEYKQVL